MRIKAGSWAAVEAANGCASGLTIVRSQYRESEAGGNPPEKPPAVKGLNFVRGSGDKKMV
jgi:hypothetical protein